MDFLKYSVITKRFKKNREKDKFIQLMYFSRGIGSLVSGLGQVRSEPGSFSIESDQFRVGSLILPSRVNSELVSYRVG